MKDLVKAIKEARFVFVCGNGGSASTAEHLTNDLFSKGIKAICLNSNTSIMTMIANDFGYEFVFEQQLIKYANSRDMLITISCSGTSANIAHALNTAVKLGMTSFEFETFMKDRNYEELENRHLQMVHKIKKML